MKKILSLAMIITIVVTIIGSASNHNNVDLETQPSAYAIMHHMLNRN